MMGRRNETWDVVVVVKNRSSSSSWRLKNIPDDQTREYFSSSLKEG
jgi:hypothetical protein